MLNVWKNLFTGNFSEKRVLPQKVALETLSSFLISTLTIFRQKTVFSTEFWNPPPALPPFWKKTIKLNLFPGKKISRRSLSGQIKTQFWQSAFKVQKTPAECLEKNLEDIDSTGKKDSSPK